MHFRSFIFRSIFNEKGEHHKKIEGSNLSEEEKKEIIHIIELYNQNKIQEALFRLIKLMSIGKDILDWFDIT
mgnify:CR=1 FL=1